jgi:hypothetical protein
MNLTRLGFIVSSLATALCALVAAIYWYLSSRPAPDALETPSASISDNPEIHILGAQVDIYSIHAALAEVSRLNKHAAIWSALAALFGAIAALISMM